MEKFKKKFINSFSKNLGKTRQELILEKDEDIYDLNKSIRDEEGIVNDENEDPAEKKRAEKRIEEKKRQLFKLENERDALALSLGERVKNIFKKYGFTVSAILLSGWLNYWSDY